MYNIMVKPGMIYPPKLNKDWQPPESEICRIRGIITERIENRLNSVK